MMACARPTLCLYPFERLFIGLYTYSFKLQSSITESTLFCKSHFGILFASPAKNKKSITDISV